jgi:hypothetical protein
MKANAGMIDRGVRVVVGAGLIAATVTGALPAWGYIGVVPLLTGLVGFCPAYMLFGFSSCKK